MPRKSVAELQSMVGETRETATDLRVERGKIAEFAAATGNTNPVHQDLDTARAMGYDDVPAPLTFTRTALFSHNRPPGYTEDHNFDLGFERGSRLHGEQEYEFERPVVAGDILSGETTLTAVFQRTGDRGGTMTFAVFETEYSDQDDELVVTERLTRIEISEHDDEPTAGESQ